MTTTPMSDEEAALWWDEGVLQFDWPSLDLFESDSTDPNVSAIRAGDGVASRPKRQQIAVFVGFIPHEMI